MRVKPDTNIIYFYILYTLYIVCVYVHCVCMIELPATLKQTLNKALNFTTFSLVCIMYIIVYLYIYHSKALRCTFAGSRLYIYIFMCIV